MTDEIRDVSRVRETTKETGALLLAIGGLAAAFGAASCSCAIMMSSPASTVCLAWAASAPGRGLAVRLLLDSAGERSRIAERQQRNITA